MYCIDASVLTNSVVVSEEFHEYSKGSLTVIKEREIMVVVPEIASAISRGTGDPYRAITPLPRFGCTP